MKINHLIFLIHPCGFEHLNEQDPDSIRRDNFGLYVEREREVKGRWLEALAEWADRDEKTLLLQLYGSRALHQLIQKSLGEASACYVRAEFPGGDQMREYYRRLTGCIRDHIEKHSLQFDPATVTSELWGGTFEGCAPGYGGAFAETLGLKLAPKMRFEMTVYDSRFLYQARRWETIPLKGSDIEAWLFECHDGSGAAIFQARLSAQWLDTRPIALQLNPTRVQVCTKTGFTVWPERPPQKGDPDQPQSFRLTTADQYWIRGIKMNLAQLREVVASASVEAMNQVQGKKCIALRSSSPAN